MAFQESNAEFLKGYVPVAFPLLGMIGGVVDGSINFDKGEPYLVEINQLHTANASLAEVQEVLSNNQEAQQVIESQITQNKDQIASLTTTVDQYQSNSDMLESLGVGTGSGILAAVLVVGGIKLWARNHRSEANSFIPKSD